MIDEPTEDMMDAGYNATRLADGTPQFAEAGFCLGHTRNIYLAMRAAKEDNAAPAKAKESDSALLRDFRCHECKVIAERLTEAPERCPECRCRSFSPVAYSERKYIPEPVYVRRWNDDRGVYEYIDVSTQTPVAPIDKLYDAVTAIAAKYAVKIDDEYRYDSAGQATLTFTHAEWREIAEMVEQQRELRAALEPFARSVLSEPQTASGWRVGYNPTLDEQKAAHLAFFGKPTTLDDLK